MSLFDEWSKVRWWKKVRNNNYTLFEFRLKYDNNNDNNTSLQIFSLLKFMHKTRTRRGRGKWGCGGRITSPFASFWKEFFIWGRSPRFLNLIHYPLPILPLSNSPQTNLNSVRKSKEKVNKCAFVRVLAWVCVHTNILNV